ncbi:MAG: hypothetical protein HY722_04815 [Planctomycetes bacterium]|nr:hypothetical protein [Planctomycetota bacterium]
MPLSGTRWTSLVLFTLAGCAGTHPAAGGRPVGDVYRESSGRGAVAAEGRLSRELRVQEPRGTVRPYVPVLSHPEVFSVYVVPHTTEGGTVSVQGHWVHIRLREARWWHEGHEEAPSFGLEHLNALMPFRPGPAPEAPESPPAPEPRMEEITPDEGAR